MHGVLPATVSVRYCTGTTHNINLIRSSPSVGPWGRRPSSDIALEAIKHRVKYLLMAGRPANHSGLACRRGRPVLIYLRAQKPG